MAHSWGWPALFLLGAYHGINPGMGWLFAVAVGMQQNSAQAVVYSLVPIALGHALAIGVAVLIGALLQIVLPLLYLKIAVGAALVALGVYRVVRSHHFRWGGMQMGFRELAIWSFLMASAHGAGLMVLPLVLTLPPMPAAHHAHMGRFGDPLTAILATLVHTIGYLTLTGAVALVVYQSLGLALLRKAWLNFDLVWAVALIATGCFAWII
ncbi:MAG: hypothetical protein JOY62_06065 [Acidobacteriaceae bacterium]|nr:hypothetical protein [Acidobacteriaceae bacterium]MBV9779523.1 hypothetical protein [Acidobacteriaceae bacterium]